MPKKNETVVTPDENEINQPTPVSVDAGAAQTDPEMEEFLATQGAAEGETGDSASKLEAEADGDASAGDESGTPLPAVWKRWRKNAKRIISAPTASVPTPNVAGRPEVPASRSASSGSTTIPTASGARSRI